MYELVLQAPESLVEPVSDALMDELDALSVSVEDSDADTDAERALFGEPGMPAPKAGWERSTLKALFETEQAASEAATLLLAQDWATEPGNSVSMTVLHEVAEQDWVRLTQSQFDPVEITPTFWIVPTWHEPPAAAKKLIRLDPGMAFGTGTHPTTRMCLGWIAAHEADVAGQRVLDYGCGSGILAIGAALHGGSPIDAVDIDPAAISTSARNAADNGVTLRSGAPDMASGEYPVVLANILATPLKMLAPLLCGHVAPGGHLVLAGILDRQADELKAAYAPWIALEVSNTVDGWILMTGRKAASA
jgi:ribosomal protein L11 methyltransferase